MDIVQKDELGLKIDSIEIEHSPDEKVVRYWLAEINDAQKREKDFRKSGREITALYEGQHAKESQFNILYSNTETLSPALYNVCPRPVVQRRFKDADPLGKVASDVSTRTLTYLLDDGIAEYSTFDTLLQQAVLEALVPGRGVTFYKYDASVEKVENRRSAEVGEGSEGSESLDDSEAPEPSDNYLERVAGETVCGEEVPWDRFCHGYAKKWKDVPWICRDHLMTQQELEDNFGAAATGVSLTNQVTPDDDDTSPSNTEGTNGLKLALVHEVWDKVSRKVYFLSPGKPNVFLKQVEDPLGLTGFFPCPAPLTFFSKISTLIPTPLYLLYEEQAKELNRVTLRINKIIAALKVRGMYDATVEGLDKVLSAEDNTLIPAENVAALVAQGNALEKAIWLFPLEKLVTVLQQLYTQRVAVKQVIYEITGIADIMRGSSQASETLGAQQIKNQWGTLRLKKMQKAVMRYARDSLRIMLEIAVKKLSPQTFMSMTGLQMPTGEQKQQAQMIVQQLAMAGQQPPQELVELLQQPSWDEVLSILQNDLARSYKVDIETNSTIDAEATEDKQNIGEMLNALAQFLNGVQPLVEAGALPFEAAQGMMLAIVRRFQFGPELEDSLKMMKPPAPPSDNGEAQKADRKSVV